MITALVLLGIAALAWLVYFIVQKGGDTLFILAGGILLVVVLTFVFALALSWPVMLLIGAAHSHYAGIPALGFWATFFLVCAVRLTTLDFNNK